MPIISKCKLYMERSSGKYSDSSVATGPLRFKHAPFEDSAHQPEQIEVNRGQLVGLFTNFEVQNSTC